MRKRAFPTIWLAAIAVIGISTISNAATVNWINPSGGYWGNPMNWSSYPYLPGSSDDAMISIPGYWPIQHDTGSHTVGSVSCNQPFILSGGTFTLQSASQFLNGFNQGGTTTLAGNGRTSIYGASQWAAGTISNLGGITNYGTWDYTSPGTRYLQGYATNEGTVTQSGPLDISSGGRFHNGSGHTYEIKADTGITSSSASGTFDNSGTVKKTTTSGVTSIACVFNNGGTLQVDTGTIQLSAGGASFGGRFASNGTYTSIDFTGGTYNINTPTDFDGYGTISLKGATLALYTGTELDVSLNRGFKISSGTITGLGRIVNTHTIDWSGGTITGIGGLENQNTMTLSGTQFKYLASGSPLSNSGTITHTSSYGLVFSGSARLGNLSGGTYEFQSDADFISIDGTGQVDNGGTIRKDYSSGTTYIDPFVNSSGGLEVDSGTMELWGGGQFVNGGASVNSLATLALKAGTFTIYGSYQADYGGVYAISGGNVTLSEGATATFGLEQGLWLSGSTVSGHGNLVNTQNMNWYSGTITGTTHFLSQPGSTVTLQGTGRTLLDNAEFDNSGTATQTGYTGLEMANGARLANVGAGSLYAFQTDVGISGSGTIDNGGTIRKSQSTGTSTITPTLNCTSGGHLDIDSGTICLTGGGAFDSGGAEVTYPGVLSIPSGTYAVRGDCPFTGDGYAHLTGGTISFGEGGTARFRLESGLTLGGATVTGHGNLINTRKMEWSSGTITGTTHFTNDGDLTISGSAQKLLSNAEFHNSGTTAQTGTVGLRMASGALLSSTTGSVYRFDTDAGISGAGTINSSGAFRKAAGTGTLTIEPSFNLISGLLDIDNGNVRLTGGGSFRGGLGEVSSHCGLLIENGSYNAYNETVFSGDGSATLSGGAIVLNDGARVRSALSGGFHLAGGTVAGLGWVTVESTGDWTAGAVVDDGTLEHTGTLTVCEDREKVLRRGHLLTKGRLNHAGTCAIDVDERSSIDIYSGGIYDLQGDGGLIGAGQVNNGGTFRKSGGAGTSVIEPALDSTGTVEVASGRLVFAGSVAQIVDRTLTRGVWIVRDGCLLQAGSGQIVTNAADVTLVGDCAFEQFDSVTTNSGTLRLLTQHSFTAQDVFTNSGTLQMDGGTFRSKKNYNTGTWTGWGLIDGGLSNSGTLSAEPVKDSLQIGGSYIQSSTGVLEVTLGGTSSGAYSTLSMGGNATIAGNLRLKFANGFVPQRGDSFKILTCRTRTGTFAYIQNYLLTNGLCVNAIYTPSSVVLVVGDPLPTPTDVASIAAAKQQPGSTWVSAPGIVSAVMSDGFFVQDANRVAGLRVTTLQPMPTVGQKIHVAGQVSPYLACLTLASAEWFTYADTPQPPKPLALTDYALGGKALGQQGGVYNATSLNNVGLLVTVTGRITYRGSGFVYIDDGSGVADGNTYGLLHTSVRGVRVMLPSGVTVSASATHATATGISYRISLLDQWQRALLLRSQGDIVCY